MSSGKKPELLGKMAESTNGLRKVHGGPLEYLVVPNIREVFIRHKDE